MSNGLNDRINPERLSDYLSALSKKAQTSLEKVDYRVFAHTNRSKAKAKDLDKKAFVYSTHPVKSVDRCVGSSPIMYPKSLLLSDVSSAVNMDTRSKIVTDVRQRYDSCEDMKQVRRTVYAGICGKLEDIDFDDVQANDYVKQALEDPRSEAFFAIFPPTFPNDVAYEAYLASNCKDLGIKENLEDSLWWYGNYEVDPAYGWIYIDVPYPMVKYPRSKQSILDGSVPIKRFNRADYIIMGGYEKGESPSNKRARKNWYVWVINPREC